MRLTIAAHISGLLIAMENCQKRIDHPISNDDKNTAHLWFGEHRKTIERLVAEYMPSGSGFDDGTRFDFDKSTPDKLVLNTAFHHMTEGMYDGWTEHTVTVKPSFTGTLIRISGPNRNEIKDYIQEAFDHALTQEIDV